MLKQTLNDIRVEMSGRYFILFGFKFHPNVWLGFVFSGWDKSWSVGTEFRQLRLFDADVADKTSMRRTMIDDVKRRHYIIDADVQVDPT